MKKQTYSDIFFFVTIILSFFGIHFIFLDRQGFDAGNYLTAFAILFPAAMVVGYVFLSVLLEHQQRQEERLEHLVREVLHEINLPLSTISANAAMIRKQAKEPRLSRRISRIESASKRLRKLYRELAYDIRREYAPPERERFDLKEVLSERVSCFEELGRNPFETDMDPLEILTDRIGLEQTVDNLIENAMKYSGADRLVRIRLKNAELSITDEGVGMDEKEILRIYERYYQSDRRIRGEGIGLAIVKRYCDEEKVGLRILSKKGKGTTVVLDFPKMSMVG